MPAFTAVVLAGGLGTRLRAVVSDRPKVLASAAGRPFIFSILDQVVDAGASKIVLCVGYLWEQVVHTIGSEYRGVSVAYSIEETPRGTGGALAGSVLQVTTDHALVLNGDSLFDLDLTSLWRRHLASKAQVTLGLKQVADVSRYGSVETDADGRVLKFREKGGAANSGWVNGGVYLMRRAFLASIPNAKQLSLEREVLATWHGEGLYAEKCEGSFLDIGVPDDYAVVDQFLSSLRAS